jgi:hypothetical protein
LILLNNAGSATPSEEGDEDSEGEEAEGGCDENA